MYSSETIIWRENEKSRIRGVQMDNLRGLLGIRRMTTAPNAWIRRMYVVINGVNERIDKIVLRWLGLIERIIVKLFNYLIIKLFN